MSEETLSPETPALEEKSSNQATISGEPETNGLVSFIANARKHWSDFREILKLKFLTLQAKMTEMQLEREEKREELKTAKEGVVNAKEKAVKKTQAKSAKKDEPSAEPHQLVKAFDWFKIRSLAWLKCQIATKSFSRKGIMICSISAGSVMSFLSAGWMFGRFLGANFVLLDRAYRLGQSTEAATAKHSAAITLIEDVNNAHMWVFMSILLFGIGLVLFTAFVVLTSKGKLEKKQWFGHVTFVSTGVFLSVLLCFIARQYGIEEAQLQSFNALKGLWEWSWQFGFIAVIASSVTFQHFWECIPCKANAAQKEDNETKP